MRRWRLERSQIHLQKFGVPNWLDSSSVRDSQELPNPAPRTDCGQPCGSGDGSEGIGNRESGIQIGLSQQSAAQQSNSGAITRVVSNRLVSDLVTASLRHLCVFLSPVTRHPSPS
jgi:hypothetical protein